MRKKKTNAPRELVANDLQLAIAIGTREKNSRCGSRRPNDDPPLRPAATSSSCASDGPFRRVVSNRNVEMQDVLTLSEF